MGGLGFTFRIFWDNSLPAHLGHGHVGEQQVKLVGKGGEGLECLLAGNKTGNLIT
ncbi:MAG TPA: hypothetical protein HPP69_10835 [Deltaproteobacteria bacterium]|nr:hypothetical protein [Deltaproteobacteria bacterium]